MTSDSLELSLVSENKVEYAEEAHGCIRRTCKLHNKGPKQKANHQLSRCETTALIMLHVCGLKTKQKHKHLAFVFLSYEFNTKVRTLA